MAKEIGIHLSYWQVKWSDDLFPLIGKAKQAGFKVAEFPLLMPEDLDYTGLKQELDRQQMLASCGTGLSLDADITSPDAAVRQNGLKFLNACIEGAAQLGSPILAGVNYAPWGMFPKDDLDDRKKRCVDSLQQVAAVAEREGITICMELLNRFEGYLINTVEQGLEIVNDVNSNYLKLHLDTFHLNIEADHIGDEIRKAGEHLGHFHCVANNRKAPGKGHIPWDEVRQALDDIHYQGYLVAETFVNPAGEVGRGLSIWRPLAEDLDENAHQTAEFIMRELAVV